MTHVVVLNSDHERAGRLALIDALREAGVGARASNGANGDGANGNGASSHGDGTPRHNSDAFDGLPLAVLYEVADGADVLELLSAVERASSEWPRVPVVACRGCAAGRDARRPDAAALKRIGFSAVADDPAQLPALLRELESRGAAVEADPPLHTSEVE